MAYDAEQRWRGNQVESTSNIKHFGDWDVGEHSYKLHSTTFNDIQLIVTSFPSPDFLHQVEYSSLLFFLTKKQAWICYLMPEVWKGKAFLC